MASLVLGSIALGVSVALAALKIWETFFRRSQLEMTFDWIQHRGAPILTFVVFNSGSKKDGVREIRFLKPDTPPGEGWFPQRAVLERLPVVLDIDEISPRFYIGTNPASTDDFDVALREGRITRAIVRNTRGAEREFAVPSPPK